MDKATAWEVKGRTWWLAANILDKVPLKQFVKH